MASEPIPEPLTNQEVRSEQETGADSSDSYRPELVAPATPPLAADRELPPVPKREEWKDAIQQKADGVKQAASEAKEKAARKAEHVKEQVSAAASETRDRAADFYRESRIRAANAWSRAQRRTTYLLDEYPLQVIGGVAAAAFVTGVLLRIWRSRRDA